MLDVALAVGGAPSWALAVVWVVDVGSWWLVLGLATVGCQSSRYGRFTRVARFEGTLGAETMALSLHRGGRYVLARSRALDPRETGWVRSGEVGTYVEEADVLRLEAQGGDMVRWLDRDARGGLHLREVRGDDGNGAWGLSAAWHLRPG
ncbi:MAG: hypothetical protein H6733_00015 [Alphaproteobacteria bacterium]|nr:hypothetical protein [Alphaproteobacteria bacterium]